MNRLRLGDALQPTSRSGRGLSSVWMVVLTMAVVHVLHDCFGWLEDDAIRFPLSLVIGVVAMMLVRWSGSRQCDHRMVFRRTQEHAVVQLPAVAEFGCGFGPELGQQVPTVFGIYLVLEPVRQSS